MMSKINQILSDWLPGDVHTLKWFREKKISQRLAYQYFEHSILNKIGHGVFVKKNSKLTWQGLIRALQQELKFNVHVSDKTALELQGSAHFLNLGSIIQLSLRGFLPKPKKCTGCFYNLLKTCEQIKISTHFVQKFSLLVTVSKSIHFKT